MLRTAVSGLGRIGWTLGFDKKRQQPASHINAILGNPDMELVAVCDVNTDRLKMFSSMYPNVKIFVDFLDMIKSENPDVIVISTPDDVHCFQTLLGAYCAKPKIIFCEKPISDNLINARKMVNVCKNRNVKLAINHTRRWMKEYKQVKKIIDTKRLGVPILFVGYYYGGLRDLVHLTDLYNWLTPNTPYQFHNIPYKLHTSYMIFEQDIFLTDGRIRICDNGREITTYKSAESEHYENIRELFIDETYHKNNSKTPLALAYEDIVKCATSSKQPECMGEDGLKALELSLKIIGNEKVEEE